MIRPTPTMMVRAVSYGRRFEVGESPSPSGGPTSRSGAAVTLRIVAGTPSAISRGSVGIPQPRNAARIERSPPIPRDQTGATALRELDWQALLARPAQMPFLNSLLHDLSVGLQTELVLPSNFLFAPETCLKLGSDAVLRNL